MRIHGVYFIPIFKKKKNQLHERKSAKESEQDKCLADLPKWQEHRSDLRPIIAWDCEP